ncbi:MAG: efflux RND transporter periplasmic adaptor subunit [Aureispira sp.]
MKNILYLLGIAAAFGLVVACGGEETAMKTPETVEEARTALKTKRQALKTLKAEIEALEVLAIKLDPNPPKKKVLPVTTAPVTVKDFNHYVEVQANVVPAQDPAYASSETGGRLINLRVKEGDYISKGALVGKVNLESIQKSIAQLDESLSLAKDIFKRQENLWNQKIGSEVQYLQAKSQVETLLKNKESLEYELSKSTIYAPISGYVDAVMVREGEMAGPGVPIITILNTKDLKVVASIPEVYLGQVKKGEAVTIKFPALEMEQQGRIKTIGRTINSANRTFEIEASVKNNGILKPNLLATVMVKDYSAKEAVVVADQLIMQDVSGADYVMVLKEGKAEKKVIETGKSFNNETVIASGLVKEDVLLMKGARQVAEGDLVKVVPQ